MAAPVDIPMPEALDIETGYTLRVTALSAADGSLVAGVRVGPVVITATPTVTGPGGEEPPAGEWFLVPGPGA